MSETLVSASDIYGYDRDGVAWYRIGDWLIVGFTFRSANEIAKVCVDHGLDRKDNSEDIIRKFGPFTKEKP